MKSQLKAATKEAKCLVGAGAKFTAIFAPIGGGVYLGLPKYDLTEFVALALVVMGVAIGVKLLRN